MLWTLHDSYGLYVSCPRAFSAYSVCMFTTKYSKDFMNQYNGVYTNMVSAQQIRVCLKTAN